MAYIEVVLNSMAWKVGRVKDVVVRCHRAFVIAKSAVLCIVWSCMCAITSVVYRLALHLMLVLEIGQCVCPSVLGPNLN